MSFFDSDSFAKELVGDLFVFGFHPACQNSVVPDEVEIMRRNVTDQLSDELDGFQGVKHLAAVVAVILELKGDHIAGVLFNSKFR